MKAVVLSQTGAPEVLQVSEVPIPGVCNGWVLVKVKAFGLNRSELMMRQFEGDAPYIQLPRILGIECVGLLEDASDSHFKKGQKVIALMGGMGRSFDGSYAEYALIPTKNVFAVDTDMNWQELAVIPETFFTAYGSLFQSLQLKPADVLLIRGGTSATGLAAIQLAKSVGATVLASTRKESKRESLIQQGTDHVLIDDDTLSKQLSNLYPHGIDKVLELIGVSSLSESMGFLKTHGIVCVTGILGEKSTISNFYPIKDIPSGVYLTGFSSNSPNQQLIDELFAHIKQFNIHPKAAKVFSLEEIAIAHQMMENNAANGKLIIVIN
ncbi:alcohol dehydrogenase [Labilibaculum manganireducens]|uniref:Alcohol dehydrogenase n=2 Tax=Labilibaculum manganireducens TaxID=1940525 RepID=A0A2N3I1G8_9BACT|nr:alcohol dehydrogenase [Labilibaculum manganireducens]